ncbi:hypothetical protein C442_05906 [Haloarcula amylolytica JCM 13557]|uniref:Uncharacterized protein n=1 Tax=Haloarcula amylolytica JCM 13557 TaxID=1227452 RepID=M0KU69_9EURY|nr:hypothetical protein C442_05906 [Haloarcula amylolytica JCM 13557]
MAGAASDNILGDFEDGVDGWKTSGGNTLETVSHSDKPAPVTRGKSALAVTSDGDPQPAVFTKARGRNSLLGDGSFLFADVLPGEVAEADSAVTFRFRLHPRGPHDVVESRPFSVKQRYGAGLAWDLRDIDEDVRAAARRLEVAWYASDDEPPTNSNGRGPGEGYNGTVYLDNIRTGDDPTTYNRRRWLRNRRRLQRENGFRTDVTVDELTDTIQRGQFVYADGTELDYEGRITDDGGLEVTIDGDTFVFGGDE